MPPFECAADLEIGDTAGLETCATGSWPAVFWIEIFQSTVFNPAMHVRPAVHADLPGILEIYNDAVLNTTATYDCEPRTLEHRLAWFEEHAKNNYPVYVAEDGLGRIVGWSALNAYHARAGYRFTTENSVYVAADHRGCGIGKRLMPPLVIAARERGLHAILAGIDAENDASIRLHASFGFVQVGCFKQVGFKFGRWLDVIYMELLLGNRE